MTNLNNVSLRLNGSDVDLMKLNGVIVYQHSSPFFVEYTVKDTDEYSLDSEKIIESDNTVYMYGLPHICSETLDYTYSYSSIEITLKDGTITTDTSTLCSDIAKIRVWYPRSAAGISFDVPLFGNPIIKDVNYIRTSNFTTMKNMFNGCDITSLDLSSFNTSKVTNMSYMFDGCDKLTSLDVSSFNTGKVTNMEYMFSGCSKLTSLDVSNFNTSKVNDMSHMFSCCDKLTSLDVSNFNTRFVNDMVMMFSYCSSLISLDLSNWQTNSVIYFGSMFKNCSSLTELNLSNWNINTDSINMHYMFSGCTALHTLRLDNCDSTTISKIITSYDFPSGPVEDGPNGQYRVIYAKRAEYFGLSSSLPDYWSFAPID